jgi:hypothetical protein
MVLAAENVSLLRGYFAGYEAIDVRGSVTSLRNGQLPPLFLLMFAGVSVRVQLSRGQQLVQTDPSRIRPQLDTLRALARFSCPARRYVPTTVGRASISNDS